MVWARSIAEGLRALAVLALVFLNFAHAPIAQAGRGLTIDILGAGSFCGEPVGGSGEGDHAPCHACRIGNGADLPPPCDVPLAVPPSRVADYVAHIDVAVAVPRRSIALARGPPLS